MAAAWPNAVLVHLPVHASWLNQVEVVFSVIQRKVIKPSDIGDADALAARLLAFQARYNTTARPFDWKFTRAGLNDLCRRIDARRGGGAISRLPERSYWADGQPARLHQDQPGPEAARPRPRTLAAAVRRQRPLHGQFAYVTAADRRTRNAAMPAALRRLRKPVGLRDLPRQPRRLPGHHPAQRLPLGTPQEALDCACGLYLADPSAWLPPGTDTPTDLRARPLAPAHGSAPSRM